MQSVVLLTILVHSYLHNDVHTRSRVLLMHTALGASAQNRSGSAASAADDWNVAAAAGALPWARHRQSHTSDGTARWGRSQSSSTSVSQTGSSYSASTARSAQTLELRRAVYSDRLVMIPAPLGRHKPRDISAQAMSRGGLDRLHPWLRRELFVLVGASPSHREFLFLLVTTLLQRLGLADSSSRSALHNELSPFLMRNTGRFIQELAAFASSPFDMIAYDQLVSYEGSRSSDDQHRQDGGGGRHASVGRNEGHRSSKRPTRRAGRDDDDDDVSLDEIADVASNDDDL